MIKYLKDIAQPRIKPLLEKIDKNYPDNTITKEYLKYLDDTYPFYPLTNDTIIKYLAKENPKWFLCFNVVTCHLGLGKINEEIIFHDKKNEVHVFIKYLEMFYNYIIIIMK